jgi:hypothetical protein
MLLESDRTANANQGLTASRDLAIPTYNGFEIQGGILCVRNPPYPSAFNC